MSDQLRGFVDRAHAAQAAVDALGAGPPVRHDCAQVERDNLDLHQALSLAIRRIRQANRLLPEDGMREVHDLVKVFERTSRPDPNITDPLRGGFAT